ncbi:hypothetical protein C791_7446 [Amycolatopsis azurea DSM 43854]|uniref:Uncharacterized protein n=1 Tax=Amycolatopsis azurea DSM 43854 TaxID=1238180 RepID=M2Q941_9PSEU|nr:hypothetical protein C791_7446 [Amycolatopsis azurea DSM 43854]
MTSLSALGVGRAPDLDAFDDPGFITGRSTGTTGQISGQESCYASRSGRDL